MSVGTRISFELAQPTKLLNQVLRMHWSKRMKHQRALAWEIRMATMNSRPVVPFQRARVRIERHSLQTPDFDGMVGGFKHLIDCLLPPSSKHPVGLGIIVDDNPDCLRLTAIAMKVARRADQKTVVVIEDINGAVEELA